MTASHASMHWVQWTHSTSWATLFMNGLWFTGASPNCSATFRASGWIRAALLLKRASAPTAKASRESLHHLEVFWASTHSLVMAR